MTETLALIAVKLLIERGQTVSTAESCTGGLIAAAITAVPGCSAVFPGSVVSYSNEVKASLLDVPREILDTQGAVSSECAEAMARGCLARFASDYAISVTGIAGPDGGSDETPVGTVYIAWAQRRSQEEPLLSSWRFSFEGERDAVRAQAVSAALQGLLTMLEPA